MSIEFIIMGALIVIIALLFLTIGKLKKNDYQGFALSMAKRDRSKLEILKPCPVCGTLLERGQTVKSIMFTGSAKKEGQNQLKVEEIITHIMGCPNCYPANSEHKRICPVCRKTVPDDGFLVARTFRKEGKKDHVHVLGCTACKKIK